ncbi:fatty acyl-AMP ligase [Actinokineospora sp. HUAS TT18]|uniref:fatty acyl-AMP ligase n=1 Tax=Actinokineospora sp. HUAS TT18 TaxID=3447451 RepID=UPI003F51DB19
MSSTLSDALAAWAHTSPDEVAVSHLDFTTAVRGARTDLTWGQLNARVDAVACWLQHRIRQGEPVAVLIGQTADYIVAFLGALRAGGVAVPLFTPDLPGHGDRLASVLRDCTARLVLTTSDSAARVRGFADDNGLPIREIVSVDTLPTAIGVDFEPLAADPDALAYLQYTSGSTGDPRGVMITHRNIMANARQAVVGYDVRRRSVTVSWLPLFHDMGLILSIGAPLEAGMRTVLMDPLAFIERPERWLHALSANPGAITAAPSFAYAYCAARVADAEKARLRLDTVDVLIDGSEPVSPTAIARFQAAFAQCGLRPWTHRPSYGLAEATVFVATARRPLTKRFDRSALAAGRLVEVAEEHTDQVRLVSCGQPIDQEVAVVDPVTGARRPGGEVGEVWVAGDNVSRGYWNRPDETAKAFGNAMPGSAAKWLATGDLGVWFEGELFITGRIKDLIVVDGRNHYPHDVERTAEAAHDAIRPRNTVAFSIDGSDGESAVVLAERAKTVAVDDVDESAVAAAVRAAVAMRHGLTLREVLLVEPDALPRTTSGKISRTACRERYLTGRA